MFYIVVLFWYNIRKGQNRRYGFLSLGKRKAGGYMPSAADIIRDSITEFSRLQNWMLSVRDKDPVTYNSMHERYIELKVTLSTLGVNLTELDRIKE